MIRLARAIPIQLNALELFLLLLCVFSGALNGARLASGGPAPDAPPGTPVWLLASWYVLLVLGGVAGLVGAFWREPLAAALITRAAMWPLAGGAFAFAWVTGSRGSPISAILVFVFALFCAAHGAQVGRRARAEALQVAIFRQEVDR